jgi:hypothetical protein
MPHPHPDRFPGEGEGDFYCKAHLSQVWRILCGSNPSTNTVELRAWRLIHKRNFANAAPRDGEHRFAAHLEAGP